METLDFTTVTDAELAEFLTLVGMTVPKKIKREEMILRLKLRILTDPRHEIAMANPIPAVTRVEGVLRALNRPFGAIYDAKGLRIARPGEMLPYREPVRASQLYEAMLHPDSFDDTLLTLVPPGTYKVDEVWDSLLPGDGRHAFSLFVPPDVRAAYKIVQRKMKKYNEAIEEGLDIAAAIATATKGPYVLPKDTPDYEVTWMEDTGRSGTSYDRLMFTLPNGDIWTAPPFGLLYHEPVPLRINGVMLEEFVQILDIYGLRGSDMIDEDSEGEVIKRALLAEGAVFTHPPRKPKEFYVSMITNLREIIDRVGMTELAQKARVATIGLSDEVRMAVVPQ